ncbi:MAG: hypothetical protein U5N85_15125 [Arcicella sp.]|nr:hypothetical protein [Arcicella sp.]
MVKHLENEEFTIDNFYKYEIWRDAYPRIHKSLLKSPKPPLKSAVRMLLERRNKAFIKLPKHLEDYTLDGLKQFFIDEKMDERDQWEPRDLHLSRTEIFISIPLFYETSKFENNKKMMDTMISVLSDEVGSFKISLNAIQYGMSKEPAIKPPNVQFDNAIFETNFDHIAQSKFFILILPDITFPYHNNHEIRLSTAFLELGFAWGQRRRIIIFCSSEMESHLPKSIIAFKDKTIKIIIGELETENDLREVVQKNEKYLLEFMKKNS